MLSSETLSAQAPAKINLGLRILARRSDGYHEIETGLIAVDWCDRITVGHADSISMTCSDRRLPTDTNNLCIQAAVELRRRHKISSGVHIHLEKQVPFGAGLGGGSSDAATTIRLVSKLWSLGLSEKEQCNVAELIGSDVPFFVRARPSIGRGRGEKLSAFEVPSVLSSLWVGIVVPNIEISTAEAYAHVTVNETPGPTLNQVLAGNDLSIWRSNLTNDFESSIFEQYPDLAEIKDRLYADGSLYASLSGSGSAVFALFDSEQRVVRAIKNASLRGWRGRFRI